MKKRGIFKSLIILILSLVTSVCAAAGLSACSKTGGSDSEGKGEDAGSGGNVADVSKWNVYDGLAVGFVSDEDCPHGDVDENKSLAELSSKLGERHYLVADFTIQAPQDNDGDGSVTAEVKISPASAVSATVQETNSGNVTEETADGVTTLKAVYKIPEKSAVERKIRLVVRLDAKDSALADISLSFDCPDNIPAVKTFGVQKQVAIGYTEELQFNGAYVSGTADKGIQTAVIPTVYGGTKIMGIRESAFKECANLQTVIMPDCVTFIGKDAFQGCTALKKFHIGGGITELGNGVFRGCDGLEEVTVSESNPIYKSAQNCILTKDAKTVVQGFKTSVIPDGAETIGGYAFADCAFLTEISLPQTLTVIEEYAFSKCGLTEISFPEGLKKIGMYAFSDCTGLTEMVIPECPDGVGSAAFTGSSVEKVTAPNYECVRANFDKTKLKIMIVTGGTSIAQSAFESWSALTSVTLPNSIKSIDKYAFNYCRKLAEINLPEGLESIGGDSFAHCESLTELTLPDSLTSIGTYAFYSCTKLTSVTIGNNLAVLGNWSFYYCSKLTNVYYKGTKEEWAAISKGAHSWDKTSSYRTIHYLGDEE